jgi:hypothetical protein
MGTKWTQWRGSGRFCAEVRGIESLLLPCIGVRGVFAVSRFYETVYAKKRPLYGYMLTKCMFCFPCAPVGIQVRKNRLVRKGRQPTIDKTC